jgi:arylsulfatase A-like enzyme
MTRNLALLCACLFAPAVSAGPPNVVMIVSDDQTWTDYSFMGHPHIHTPHLDKLARESLTFRRGYVPSSLCRPSLAALLTGLYPHQHKITSNDPPLPRGKKFLAQRQQMIDYIDKVPTLPRMLGKQGYLSFQSGKWWEGNYRRGGFTHGMTHGDPKRGGRHGDVGLAIGRKGMKEVFDFLATARKEKKPFFLWYAPMMPHSPHTPPARLLAKYRDKTPSLHMAKYWAMCEWFDETCGELLGYLDKEGLAKDTLVVYLADNGWIQDPDSPRYAPRSKRSPYDGGLRTPIMVRWPGKVKPRFSDELAISVDLAPTILKACGLEPTPAMQGVNLLDAEAVKKRERIFGETFTHNAVDIHDPGANLQYRWVIEGEWKLLVPNRANVPKGKVELYHITRDPHEKENLAGKQPDRVKHLREELDRWWDGKKGSK